MKANISELRRWVNTGLGFIYPEICQICRKERADAEEGFVCETCWQKVRFIKPPFCERCGMPYEGAISAEFECSNCREMDLHFSSARSSVVAAEPVLGAIHQYKYQQALWFEPFLCGLLEREAVPALAGGKWDAITPVPLHPARRRERQFNQAERIARWLSRATGIALNSRLLKRVEMTRTQTQLNRQERSDNVKRAFAMRSGQKLDRLKIILVDDVFTTGATTSACARVLRSAGAADVCVWTVARGLGSLV